MVFLTAPNEIETSFVVEDTNLISMIEQNKIGDKKTLNLILTRHNLNLLRDYDQLLCLRQIKIEKYWHQIETVRKVLKNFHGRVLLCDEVGLGKTIESGMLILEYLLRGLARRVLILTPPALLFQWQDELAIKFGLDFVTNEQNCFKLAKLDHFPLLICSINYAKSKNNFAKFISQEYDLIVVDEAHHLKNPQTLNWKLINSLKKKFIFLLTATPVQNNLLELFNLLTLLKPGVLKTAKSFKAQYMSKDDPKQPQHPEKLRELLREVMIRNTRSLVDIKLPKRFAQTFIVEGSAPEMELHRELNAFLKNQQLDRLTLSLCLQEASSSPAALASSLKKLEARLSPVPVALLAIQEKLSSLKTTGKDVKLLELLRKSRDKKVVFVHFTKTLEHLKEICQKNSLNFVEFQGGMSAVEKEQAIDTFRDKAEILLSSESGGEGRNLQFCNTIINYDLPWNPMRIEQRIGRIHRIGQTRDVFVFNLCLRGSLEDHLLQVLEHKINMFELVIGEIGSILGNLKEEVDFSDIILNLWLAASAPEELETRFALLGEELVAARELYQETKALDQKLFGEDYET